MSNVLRITRKSLWGTYGKGGFEHCAGRCPEHQLRWKPLEDCDTDHLQMILRNQRQVQSCPDLKRAIHELLFERGASAPEFDPVAERELADAAFNGMWGFITKGCEGLNEATKKDDLVN
jgi:hypothetical protein